MVSIVVHQVFLQMDGGWVEVVHGAILAINSPALLLHCEKFAHSISINNEVIDVLINLG